MALRAEVAQFLPPPSPQVFSGGDSEPWEVLGKHGLNAWSLIKCPKNQMF